MVLFLLFQRLTTLRPKTLFWTDVLFRSIFLIEFDFGLGTVHVFCPLGFSKKSGWIYTPINNTINLRSYLLEQTILLNRMSNCNLWKLQLENTLHLHWKSMFDDSNIMTRKSFQFIFKVIGWVSRRATNTLRQMIKRLYEPGNFNAWTAD